MVTYSGGDCIAEAMGTVWKRPVLWSGLGLATLLPDFLGTLGGAPKPDVATGSGTTWIVDLPGIVVSRTSLEELVRALRAMMTPSLLLSSGLLLLLVFVAWLVLYSAALVDRTGKEVRLDRLPIDVRSLLRYLGATLFCVVGFGAVVLAARWAGVPKGFTLGFFLFLLVVSMLRLSLVPVLLADGSTLPQAFRQSWSGLRGHTIFVAGVYVRLAIVGVLLTIPTFVLSLLIVHDPLPTWVVPAINLVFKAPYQAVVALAFAAMTREFVVLPQDPAGALIEQPV